VKQDERGERLKASSTTTSHHTVEPSPGVPPPSRRAHVGSLEADVSLMCVCVSWVGPLQATCGSVETAADQAHERGVRAAVLLSTSSPHRGYRSAAHPTNTSGRPSRMPCTEISCVWYRCIHPSHPKGR
jgi:hypothetical protein